jgi:anti-sigma B factor antagonist
MGDEAPGFERVDRDGTPTLVITGEIDLACADELREQLRALTPSASRTGVVDLSGVTFLDSSGLGVLIAAKKHAVATDTDLALADPSPACRSVLSISGADQFFEIHGG